MAISHKKKFFLRKNAVFLGLIKNYRTYNIGLYLSETSRHKSSFSFLFYKQYYIPLMNIFYIFDILKAWQHLKTIKINNTYNLLQYYAAVNYYNSSTPGPFYKNLINYKQRNIVVFSRPSKQVFLLFFKAKPIFIFTGGLMRIVMREKRKSSKKLYKVASSLIKLFTILLVKKDFFPQSELKLINVGILRYKILKSLLKLKKMSKILYVIIKFRIDFTSQKLETRRAIKKYVKKRFNVR